MITYKTSLTILLLFFCASICLNAQSSRSFMDTSDWTLTIEDHPGISTPINFVLKRPSTTPSNSLTGLIASYEVTLNGQPYLGHATFMSRGNKSLIFAVKNTSGMITFQGTISAEGDVVEGTCRQGNQEYPCVFAKEE